MSSPLTPRRATSADCAAIAAIYTAGAPLG